MVQSKYSLTRSSWDHKEREAIQEVVDSGNLTMGTKVKQFERDFAAYTGAKYCVMVNSGSSANLLATAAMFYKPNPLVRDDEVIVPALAWSTTYAPLTQYGLKLKFVDIDIHTLNYDIDSLNNAITIDTKMVILVHALGNPIDYDALNIPGHIIVIEDCCEAMGAKYNGRHVGRHGLASTFSTFYSHHISTIEGGLIITDDYEIYELLLMLRAHGWTRDLPGGQPNSFDFEIPGYNVRPTEIAGAIGIEQLKKLDQLVWYRQQNAAIYKELFSNNHNYIIQQETGNSSWFGFYFNAWRKDQLLPLLQRSNIETRSVMGGNFLKQNAAKWMDTTADTTTMIDRTDIFGFYVGNYGQDLSDELERLKRVIK